MSDTAASLPINTYLAQANLTLGGQFVAWGTEVELASLPDVNECVAVGLLIPRGADGSYPENMPVQPARCCGG